MRKQFAKTMLEAGSDDRLAILIGDISHFLLRDLEAKYKERFYNLGVAEQSMMSMAAGLAVNGFFPVVHTIAPFITERCLEQVKDDLCYQKLGVNIITVGAAFDYAALGCTHHCYDDIAIMRAQPNMQIVYPGAPYEFDILFKETYANGMPTYFRLSEHKHSVATSPKFGELEKLHEGKDITIIVAGPQLGNALAAAEKADAKGIGCELIYLTTIKPLSQEAKNIIRNSLKKTGYLITIEEHSIVGGIADEMRIIASDLLYKEIRMGVPDTFLTNYGTYEEHCNALGLTEEGILATIHESQR
jgi:transketolase